MKRWVMMGLVAVMFFTHSTVSFADDRGRGRWEGIAIGLGVVTLYNLFQHGQFSPVITPQRVYQSPPVVCQPSGHWEIHRQWIPERREYVRIPDHYEGGYWVKGHHEVRIYPGYYEDRKVWVEGPRGY